MHTSFESNDLIFFIIININRTFYLIVDEFGYHINLGTLELIIFFYFLRIDLFIIASSIILCILSVFFFCFFVLFRHTFSVLFSIFFYFLFVSFRYIPVQISGTLSYLFPSYNTINLYSFLATLLCYLHSTVYIFL